MKEIRLEENGNVLTFNFLNGSIELDESIYGAYALSPGCGSGKTTIIKELISKKWNEGILYSAFTKDEVNSMYQFCKTLVGLKLRDRDGGYSELKLEDIIVLHSDYTAEGVDNNLWRNNPQELLNKKIVLCTHAKLLDEPLYLLVSTNFNDKMANMFPPTYRAMNNIGNSMPRQWILIDEMTEAKITLANMKKVMFSSLGMLTNQIKVIDKFGRPTTEVLNKLVFERTSLYYDEFVKMVEGLRKFIPEFKDLLKDESNELNKIRNERLLENLYLNFKLYANNDLNNVKINSSFTDMINGREQTHILLFDGTSDITLYNSKKFKVLDFNNKYNGDLKLFKFPFDMSRKIKSNGKDSKLIDTEIRKEIDKVVDNLSEVLNKNKKVLIFTWKDFKTDGTEINDEEYSPNIVTGDEVISINKNFSFPEYLKFKLEEKGFIEGENFSIEYYGSGRDKAINEYREYDGVVLLGKYVVPNSVITDFNIMFHSNIGFTEYYTNRVIQAITRVRIRNHNNESVNIYMSDDWSLDIINSVKKYLKIEDTLITFNMAPDESIKYMSSKLRSKNISPKKAEQIAKLSVLDENIFNSIMEGYTYNCSIKLNDIFRVLPMSRKKSTEYKNIINNLSKLGINLSLT